ncbi:MAG: DUF2339 domain-containing protein [Sulfurimicrobium sp.]|nr:DUF2339 domain-containing protein [Sulfurimicrobium sp.]
MYSLYVILGLLFLAAPLLGIIAYLRVNQMEKTLRSHRANDALADRVSALEAEIARLRLQHIEHPDAILAAATVTEALTEPPPRQQAKPAPAPQLRLASKPAPKLDLESLIAGRWLNRIGIIALLLAGSFFLKFAFDNDWIGPAGRVAIGLLSGSALIVFSQTILKRGYSYFSDGIAGLGAGVLYLSLYAAHQFYQLIPSWAAFGGMAIITAALMVLALGRDSVRIALLALAGGFVTPALLSSGVDAQIQLFTYIAVLNTGLLLLARRRDWDVLPPLALLATILYYIGWHGQFYRDATHLLPTLAFLTLFFAQFSALSMIQARRGGRLNGLQILLLVLTAGAYLVALGDLLYDLHREQLTLALLLLSAAYLGMMRLTPPAASRLLFAATALTSATLAIPVQLEGEWIAIAWAIKGAALAGSGFRTNHAGLRGGGLILLALAALTLISDLPDGGDFLLNARFAAFAVLVTCLGLSATWAFRNGETLSSNERFAFGVVGVAANVFALWGLSLELWDVFSTGQRHGLAQMLSLSLLWAAYATLLILVGVRRDIAALRWQALALFGLLVGKVFLYDLSLLDKAYRIVSFFALGTALLVVSFFYQRRQAADKSEKKP